MATKKEAASNEQQEVKETATATVAAEAEDIIAKAKAEAAAILAEAEAKAKETVEAAKETAPAGKEAQGEKMVPIRLFKDNEKYKDDVFVAVNGENCVIKRGERVQIKRKFAEVLDHSEHQDYETSLLIEQKTREGAKALSEM